jgi:hypothetical protein
MNLWIEYVTTVQGYRSTGTSTSAVNFMHLDSNKYHQVEFDTTPTTTMFYVIGLGLSDEKDITVKGLEVRYMLLEA